MLYDMLRQMIIQPRPASARKKKVQTAFRLPEDLIERLKLAARKEGKTLNGYVQGVLDKSVSEARQEKEKAQLIAELKAAKRNPEQVAGVDALVGICKCRREDFLDDERALYLWDKGRSL